jgi:L-iditol 2-dehydrogenase
VWGDGPVGLCFARWVKITGAYPVILCGRHDDRLAFALKFGADFVINQKKENVAEKVMKYTDGQGVAKVANAVGTNKLIEDSLDFLANMGTIGMYGLQDTSTPPKPEQTTINFGKRIFTWNGWNLGAVGPDEARVHQQVLDAVKFGIFDPKSLITHVMPLAEIREGMELIKQRKALKVVVECGNRKRKGFKTTISGLVLVCSRARLIPAVFYRKKNPAHSTDIAESYRIFILTNTSVQI